MALSDCTADPSRPLTEPPQANITVSPDNPFAKRESMSNQRLLWYKVLTILSWLLVVVMVLIYHSKHPTESSHSHSIWEQNRRHPTPFTLNKIVTDLYWYVDDTSLLIYLS